MIRVSSPNHISKSSKKTCARTYVWAQVFTFADFCGKKNSEML